MSEASATTQGSAATAAPLPPSGAFKPLVSLRERWGLALTIMMITGAIAAPLAWFKAPPHQYETTAYIYVATRFAKVLKGDQELEFASTTQYLQYVDQQTRNLGRYDIALATLNALGSYRSLWQQPGQTDRKAALGLAKAITARALKGTYLISVTLTGNQVDGLAETLNSLLHIYLEIVKKEDLFASDERLERLRERQTVLAQDIQEKSTRRATLAEQLGVTGFEDKTQNPYERLLQDSQTALAALGRRRIEAEVALRAYDAKQNPGAKAALDAAAGQIVANDSGLNSLKYHLLARRGQLLDEISGLSPQHPLRTVAERKLRDLENEVKTASEKLLDEARFQLLEQRRTAVREMREVEQALLTEQQRLQEKTTWFINNNNEGVDLSQEISRARTQLDAVNERIDFLTLESEAPGFLRLQSAAMPPEYPVGGGPKKLVALALMAAIALGLITPILLDLLDSRIKTAAQVHRLLEFAPLAAFLDKTDLRNRRVWNDQMRRLILTLGRESRQHGTRRIVLTSVEAGSGVTELIFDLARELALDGLRVIAVEANALKPDERYMTRLLGPGLIDVLNGEVALDQAIVPAEAELPDRMAVGLALQRHLPFYDRFPGVLDPLLERYDLILLDAPPILLSADTEFLARYADAVLLVVSARQTLKGELKRAARLLEKAAPQVFGVIVNRLQVYHGGGYYAEVIKKYEDSEQAAAHLLQVRLEQERAAREPEADAPSVAKGVRGHWLKWPWC